MANDVPRILSGRYEIGELIGRGGMAEVYIGRDNRLGRTVAIKMLRADLARDPSFHTRFRREAQSAASLNHPAIVSVYDTGEESTTAVDGTDVDIPFIVMEYVEGHTVRDLLTGGSALPLDEAVEITQGVLSALEYSHHAGIVHRDIKPANVMLTPTGAVKVMDFGIARAMADSSATMTQTQAVVGTAQYLSPEQARGEVVDTRSDLYSTGCLLYELLTGRPPFTGDSAVSVAYQHVSETPKLPSEVASDVPEALDRIVMKALTKDRDQRYATAAEFRADLDAAVSNGIVQAPSLAAAAPPTQLLGAPSSAPSPFPSAVHTPEGLPEEEEKPKRSKALIWILAAVAVVAAVAITLLLINRPSAPATVSVPDLAGMNQDEARAALDKVVPADADNPEGLQLVVGDPISSDDVPEGQAVNWTPKTGTDVPAGSQVTVRFSDGPGELEVPDVTGMSLDEAKAELESKGFDPAGFSTDTKDQSGAKKDEVLETNPKAGEKVAPDSSITIIVAKGELEVPDVTGMSQEQARSTLESKGFDPAGFSTDTKDAPGADKDEVVETDPKAGKKVSADSPITIILASGNVELPDLEGKDLEEANAILQKLHLTSTTTEKADPGDPGVVLSQSPAAGTIKNDTRVELTVSVPAQGDSDSQTGNDSSNGQPSGDSSDNSSGQGSNGDNSANGNDSGNDSGDNP